jgi:hypothetical protein
MSRTTRAITIAGLAALALACGGGTTPADNTAPTATPSTATAPSAPSGSFGDWGTSELQGALAANGWTVTECYSYTDEGIRDDECSAKKGNQWAEIDIDRYETREDAQWMAEDAQGVAVDGKSVLDITVYNGDEAEKILGAVLPKGAKITEVKADTVVKHLEKGGYSIIEKSMSTSDGYTYNDIEGEKAGRSYVSIDWEYVPGSSTADEDRELDGGYASVYQGDDNDLSIYVYDYKAANELVKTLVK